MSRPFAFSFTPLETIFIFSQLLSKMEILSSLHVDYVKAHFYDN